MWKEQHLNPQAKVLVGQLIPLEKSWVLSSPGIFVDLVWCLSHVLTNQGVVGHGGDLGDPILSPYTCTP